MRITNNMITGNTKSNINSNKILVDRYNTQMTTQKKISKASENPVIAIRSLRLGTSLSHIDQYVDNNIPDAESWLDVTETALTNMKNILTDIRTQCVNGSTDTLTADDRNTILKNLSALSDQVYTEGNADYAGRTVFTGYRTSSNLTFLEDEKDTTYTIEQNFSFQDLEEHRYYAAGVEVPPLIVTGSANPNDDTPDCDTEIENNTYNRIRFAYDDTEVDLGKDAVTGESLFTIKDKDGNVLHDADNANYTITKYDSLDDWHNAYGGIEKVPDDEIVIIKETGEMIFGKDIAAELKQKEATISLEYTKIGFDKGEARPEYYYNCVDKTATLAEPIEYKKEDQSIKFMIANATELTVNTQASDVFDTSIKRDIDEMVSIVQNTIAAHDKVDKIKSMMKEVQYSDEASQAVLQTYLDAAQKEADYLDDHLQKSYGNYITKFDGYLERVNISITNIGSMTDRLNLTKTRVENQQSTVEELKTNNEDRDISDIIIDYYASYNAYQSSLTAASKVGKQTLLDYI